MRKLFGIVVILVVSSFLTSCKLKPQPGHVKDEALLAGRDGASMPGADEDYYADMDYGLTKNPEGIRASLDPYLPGISAAEAVNPLPIGRHHSIPPTPRPP